MNFLHQPSRATQVAAWIIAVFMMIPILVIIPISLTDRNYLSLPAHKFSLQYYERLAGSEAWMNSISQSFIVALLTTCVAIVLGVACAIGCWRLANRWGKMAYTLILVPLVVPHMVYALGIFQFFAKLDLIDTYTGVVLAHSVLCMPYVVITVTAALAQLDGAIERAARSMGAGPVRTIFNVIVPNILPGIISGAILAFIHSWDELVVALFIASRSLFTVPRRMWDGLSDQLDPTMAAVAVLVVVISALLAYSDSLLRQRDVDPKTAK